MAYKNAKPTANELILYKYEKKLSFWKNKEDDAKKKRDWSALNWAQNQIHQIEIQVEECRVNVNQIHYLAAIKTIKENELRID